MTLFKKLILSSLILCPLTSFADTPIQELKSCAQALVADAKATIDSVKCATLVQNISVQVKFSGCINAYEQKTGSRYEPEVTQLLSNSTNDLVNYLNTRRDQCNEAMGSPQDFNGTQIGQ